ncbi:MAG: DUF805 domain-containing protein [Fibromonadaceae bacterium]|jgi:uncharacterized protein (TIGR02145 family)|nr:DUF805 domain-containing protein [Fibromonadaceae bacterium]
MSEPQQKAEDEMFCSSCGAIIKKAAWICPKCGAKPMRAEEAVLKPTIEVTPDIAEVEKLSLFGYHVKCLKNYTDFEGRAKRKEYWGFVLFMYITMTVLSVADFIFWGSDGITILSYLYALAVLLPELAVFVRRMHDIGQSGSWVAIYFILCLISWISSSIEPISSVAMGTWFLVMVFTIVLGCIDSQTGENEYGSNPKGISHEKKPAWLIRFILCTIGLLLGYALISLYDDGNKMLNPIESEMLMDLRDTKVYKTIKIGEQIWMAENLNYDGSDIGKCYDNDSENCKIYGRLYNWDEAMNACPEGWHLPRYSEWEILYKNTKRIFKNTDKRLKARSGWEMYNGMDIYGFAALPGGYCIDKFNGLGHFGFWWTATEAVGFNLAAKYWSIGLHKTTTTSELSKSLLMSVRCVKD